MGARTEPLTGASCPRLVLAMMLLGPALRLPLAGEDVAAPGPPPPGASHGHWAFRPPSAPAPPVVIGRDWVANPIDAFVLARLEARGVPPNPAATPRELVRRLHFDLLGLVPPPQTIDRFAADPTDLAWASLVDELLARPEYGERWGRHWLDVVRYADTNGYERDDEKPYSWRYRDYVIKSFNDDKPYDRFIREQIAGDELPDAGPESIIATGFYRLGVWDDEPDDARMAELDYLDDIIRATGSAFLGLTVGCARCHDHKFDPIGAKDYYSLLAFLRSLSPHSAPRYDLQSPAYAPLAAPADVARWRAGHDAETARLEGELARCGSAEEKPRLEEALKKHKATAPPFEWALAAREHRTAPAETQILIRGDAGSPAAAVEPAFLEALGAARPRAAVPRADNGSTGLRHVLGEWLSSPHHPLAARVMANRVWQHHFGRGIVETSGDFGKAGVAPTHPELLDWLALRLVESGWSVKSLHRLILTSRTYRLSSSQNNQGARAADEGNQLLWRQGLRRLDAESLRDSILAVSGALSSKMGGRGMFPRLEKEIIAGGSRPGRGWELSGAAERNRRSIYVFVKRTMQDPLLEGFDYTNTAQPIEARPSTTVAPQALLLLNSRFADEQASRFAGRLEREAGSDEAARVVHAYRLALGRSPNASELRLALGFLERQEADFAALPPSLTFSALAASALSADFLGRHQPEDFLGGPRRGWSYHRGAWGDGYEGIELVDPVRGPYALVDDLDAADVEIACRVRLRPGVETFSLLFRARPHGTVFTGLEAALDLRAGKVLVRRHDEAGAATLGERPAAIRLDAVHSIGVSAAGNAVTVAVDGAHALRVELDSASAGAGPGKVGIKTWGATADVLELAVDAPATRRDLVLEGQDPLATPAQRALGSWARVVFNLNEFLYVD